MSKFITLLSNTIEKWGYIPSIEEQYETTELIASFNASEDIEGLFQMIEAQRQEMVSGSIVRLVKGLLDEQKIPDTTSIITWIGKIFFLGDNHKHLDKYLIHIFFSVSREDAVLEDFVKRANHKEGLQYEGLKVLLIETTAHIKNDSIFRDVYTNTLNVDAGSYGDVGFYDEPYIRMAQSTELDKFIDTITSAEYTQAFDTFLGGWSESVQKFFANIPTTLENQAIIANLITHDPTGSHDRLLSTYKGFDTKRILTHAFDFLSKCGGILHILRPYISSGYEFYTVREYISAHIRGEEIIALKNILGAKHINHIITLYEDINATEGREDKDAILAVIAALPEFADAKERTISGREQYHIEEQQITEAKNQEIRRDINDAISVTVAHGDINIGVIDLYLKHKTHFTDEEKGVVREHIERFFRWNLFPIESITRNIWYIRGFFLDSLEIAQELNITLPSHDILIRSLACMWIDQRVRKQIFPLVSSLTEQDVRIIASVYDGSRTDDLALSLGGQSFFALYDQYESDFQSEIGSLRKILYAFINHQDIDVWTKKRAIEILTHTSVWDGEIDLPIIQNLWRDLLRQNPGNLVECYHRGFDYILCVNQALMSLGIDEAIQWRFDQLLYARIDMPDPWKNSSGELARAISDTESEITHEKRIIAGLANINLKKWEKQILQLMSYGIELVNEDQEKFRLYSNYIIYGLFSIIAENQDLKNGFYFRKRFQALVDMHSGPGKHIGVHGLDGFYNTLEGRVFEVIEEKDKIESELIRLKPQYILLIEDDNKDTKKLWGEWIKTLNLEFQISIFSTGGCNKFDVETKVIEIQKSDPSYLPKIFRILDRDGFSDDITQEVSSFFQRKQQNRGLKGEYKILFLPVCEIENFAIENLDTYNESEHLEHLHRTIKHRLSELKKHSSELNIFPLGSDGKPQISDEALTSIASTLLDDVRKNPVKYGPGKEMQPGAIKKLLTGLSNPSNDIKNFLYQVKSFFENKRYNY